MKNYQEPPQGDLLTDSITPILQKRHPEGNYCIGRDCGIYWRLPDPPEAPEKGAEAPDWFYIPDVPPTVNGQIRRSYVLWRCSPCGTITGFGGRAGMILLLLNVSLNYEYNIIDAADTCPYYLQSARRQT